MSSQFIPGKSTLGTFDAPWLYQPLKPKILISTR